ncbi:MAG: hypothetical protein QQN43_06425 [Nitrosopumilus sp.]|nr:hypothetical protein [Nitrososphaerota archaeon]
MSQKCPECNKGNESYKEIFEGLTVTYYFCGHRQIARVINESIVIKENAELYLNKTEEELYQQLGGIYKPDSALTATIIDTLKKGKDRFREHQKKLFNFLCVEKQICEKIKKFESLETLSIYGMISQELITGNILPTWIPIGIVSGIIVKVGIKKYCNC